MKNRSYVAILVLGIAILTACAGEPADAAEPTMTTDEQKTLYALGQIISRNLAPFGLSEADLEFVKAGLTDGVLQREAKVAIETYGPKVSELAQTRATASAGVEKQASTEFLAQAAKEEGAVKTESGLVYKELQPGTGDAPQPTDTVRVHYHGTLRDGKVFDSSVDRDQPAEFKLNGVIPCWTEGLQRMKVGGKARLVCPADIAYGDSGAGADIKPGATLVFDVELLAIVK